MLPYRGRNEDSNNDVGSNEDSINVGSKPKRYGRDVSPSRRVNDYYYPGRESSPTPGSRRLSILRDKIDERRDHEERKWHSPTEVKKREIAVQEIIRRGEREEQEREERERIKREMEEQYRQSQSYRNMVEHQSQFEELQRLNPGIRIDYFSLKKKNPSERIGGRILKNNNKKQKKISEKVKKPKKISEKVKKPKKISEKVKKPKKISEKIKKPKKVSEKVKNPHIYKYL